jgi:hypothetical protein
MEDFTLSFIKAFPIGLWSLIGGCMGYYLSCYFQEKGKNLATKEDIKEITEKVEFVKNQFSKKHIRSKAYIEKQILAYDEVCKCLYEIKKLSYVISPKIQFIEVESSKVCQSKYELSSKLLDKLEEHQIYLSPMVDHAATCISEELYKLSKDQYFAHDMIETDLALGLDNRERILPQWNIIRDLIDDTQILIRRELIDE